VTHLYLGAVAFGLTLLVASFVLGGKDVHAGHAGHGDSAPGLGWAPVTSLRFWVFVLTFGGGAGLALDALGSSELVAAIGALVIGWASGALAVGIIRGLTKRSVSSAIGAHELVGMTGQLLLPAGPGKPSQVRISIKGRTEDFTAMVADDSTELPTGAPVTVVAEGEHGALLVAKPEM